MSTTTTTKKNYSPDTGELISLEKAQTMMNNYDAHEKRKGKQKFTKGYFFGKNKLQELLNCEGSIGLRIYYGIDIDGDGKDDKKMVIFPVDKNGNDMPYHPPHNNIDGADVKTMEAFGRTSSPGRVLDAGTPTP